jgi:hypothetical protein
MTELTDYPKTPKNEVVDPELSVEGGIVSTELAVSIDPSFPIVNPEIKEQDQSKFKRVMHVAKRAVQSAVITVEVLPTNGLITYGIPAAVFVATRNVAAASAAAGVLTGVLESGGALATADILSNSPNNPIISRAQALLDSRPVRRMLATRNGKMSVPVEGLIALYGGTPAVMLAKESEPDANERTHQERRKYGLLTAAVLGGICTAQMALYTEGAGSLLEGDPKVTAAVAAVGVGSYGWLRRTRNHAKAEKAAQESIPRYDLSEKELKLLEEDLVADVEKESRQGFLRRKQPGVYAVWMKPDNRYVNILRTYEAGYFPEVKEVTDDIEEETLFLAMVDTRPGAKRVVHAATVSGVRKDAPEILAVEGKTGFTTIDALIQEGNFTAEEFGAYYADRGVDTTHSMSIDTNFRVGDKAEKVKGIGISDLTYLALFDQFLMHTPEGANAAGFASINRVSMLSFKKLGMQYEPLMGRTDFVTPEEKDGKEFHPIMIPLTPDIRALFAGLRDYKAPEINLT